MDVAFIGRLGRMSIDRAQTYIHMGNILLQTAQAFAKFVFFNHAVNRVLIRQIYFTAVQPLFIFLLAALVLGSITVNYLLAFLTSLGAYDQIGYYLIRAMLHEIAPITCTLIILLRSGTAIISEVALMKLNKEFDTLTMLNISIPNYIYLPRVMAFVISGPTLTICFSFVGLIGGFLILGYFHDITFDSYIDQLFTAVQIRSMIILILKPLFMSLGVVLICLQKGITVKSSFTEVPIKLIQGMIHTVTIVIIIEIIFSIVSKIL